MTEEIHTHFQSENYAQVICLLEAEIKKGNEEGDIYHLLSQSYMAVGNIGHACIYAEKSCLLDPDAVLLREHLHACKEAKHTINSAIAQITDGEHNSKQINFVKANTLQIIESKDYQLAIAQLYRLTKARKAKTTNIIWIGGYLKNVYFHTEATMYQALFDKILLDEIVFYYLKAGKLYEKGYQVIRDAIKALAKK